MALAPVSGTTSPVDPTALQGGGEAAPIEASGGEAPVETVVCTVVTLGDGSYKLYHGDEPEAGGGDEAEQVGIGGDTGAEAEGQGAGAEAIGEGEGEEGAPGGEMEAAPEGKVYTDVGALLKGVLECVQDHHEASGGETDQQSFEGGYASASGAPTPKGAI